ncbi:MAG: hypothetical protein JXM69_17170 [Anaerolineae bacterium]|nr:hypothetical protein [Anaerolineae bacterium]
MRSKKNDLPVWVAVDAWREILARIFDKIEVKYNVQPEWLVNPATNRRLKLDLLYPEIGVAIYLAGLQGKQRRHRPSLEEEEQARIRAQARVEVCRAHGVELIVVEAGDEPNTIFHNIDLALSRAKQRATGYKAAQKIGQARASSAELARRIKSYADLSLYAELWQDRQYQIPEPQVTASPTRRASSITFTKGMEVEHAMFGPGVILAVTPSDDDTLLTVDFITAGQKTLAASLVGDKLKPR